MQARWKWWLLGLFVASMLGITTEQIFQNVYDPVNVALRGNIVVGGGGGATPVPQPTATPLAFGANGVVPVFAATEFGSYAGASCVSGFLTAIDGGGALTCATPVPAAPAATPTLVPTATPQPTATPRSPVYRSLVTSGTTSLVANGPQTTQFAPFGGSSDTGSNQPNYEVPVPIAATVKNLSCYLTTAPGVGNSWTIALWSGNCGSASISALTCTISNTSQTCTDNSHSVSIAANQCALLNISSASTPPSTRYLCSLEADY